MATQVLGQSFPSTGETFIASKVSGVAILAGAFICMSFILVTSFLAGGIGLTFENLDRWALIIGGVGLIVPFVIGGFVTTRLARGSGSGFPYLHTLAMWAIVVVSTFFVLSSQATSIANVVLAQLGAGSFATVQSNALLEQLSEIQPQFETEVSLKEGKAVTTLKIEPAKGSQSGETKEAMREEAKFMKNQKDELVKAAKPIEKAGRAASWAGFSGLVAALFASLLGSAIGGRVRRKEP